MLTRDYLVSLIFDAEQNYAYQFFRDEHPEPTREDRIDSVLSDIPMDDWDDPLIEMRAMDIFDDRHFSA